MRKENYWLKCRNTRKCIKNNKCKLQTCKRQLRKVKRRTKLLEENICSLKGENLFSRIFNEDQTVALRKMQAKKTTKFIKWTNSTVTKSLKLKFSCGNNGYQELLKQGYPLPSVRTLQRRLQTLKFDSGIVDEVFQFLKIKVQCFESHERDCTLVLDEMTITPGTTWDSSLN